MPSPALVQGLMRSLFGGDDPTIADHLARTLQRRHLACGQRLWQQGDPADFLVWVVRGRLQVELGDGHGGDPEHHGEVGRGQALGVAEVVGRRRRLATVTATRETELLLLPGPDFEAALTLAPAFAIPLLRHLATRLGDALRGEQGFHAPETVTLLPLSDDPALLRLGAELARELQRYGTAHVIDALEVDRRFRPGSARGPADAAEDAAIDRWLDDLDDRHDLDLYVADPTPSAWTRRCLARADRILLVAAATDDRPRDLRAVEALCADDGPIPNRAPRELVLVHPVDASAPQGTAEWLQSRPLTRVHHVRGLDRAGAGQGHRGDLARVARRLLGRSIGLVLSGGAARGMVHIGVIQGLLEAGVPLDAVGGASSGGGVGVLFAADFSPTDMIAGIQDAWIESRVFARPRVPMVSLLESSRVRERIIHWLGERDMTDLWRDCYVVATNLTRARLEILDRGPAWRAILATSAIPGLLPPALRRGEVLVDGGVLDNLPLRAMLTRNPGKIIASDVGDLSDTIRADPSLDQCPRNSTLLFELLNPLRRRTEVPSVGSTLLAAATCSSRLRDPALVEATLHCFCPDLRGLPTLSFDDPKPLVAAGYRAAREAIDAGVFSDVLAAASGEPLPP